MAEGYHRSELRRHLAAARQLHREVPLAFTEDGVMVHGVVDLIVEEEDHSLTILDWKTDRLDATDPDAKASEYREQLESYARGIELAMATAMDLTQPPKTLVHFLRDDITVQLPLT